MVRDNREVEKSDFTALVEEFKSLAVAKFKCNIEGVSACKLDKFELDLAPFRLGEDLRIFLSHFGGGAIRVGGEIAFRDPYYEKILFDSEVLSLDRSLEQYQWFVSALAADVEIFPRGWPSALLPLCVSEYTILVLLSKEVLAESEVIIFYPSDGDTELYIGHQSISRMLELGTAYLNGQEVDVLGTLETTENGDSIRIDLAGDTIPSEWFV